MNYIVWIKKLEKESEGKYKKAVCPFLQDNKCSIYSKRFTCCRHFPQSKGYCSQKTDCLIKNKKNRNNISETCSVCLPNCCRGIVVPKNITITKDFIKKWMNITCDDCVKIFK